MQSPCNLRGHAATMIGVLLAALLMWPTASPAQPITPTPAQPPQTEAGQHTAAERENWRKAILAAPRPTNGCQTATFPERQWREVPCQMSPHKLYRPRSGGTTRLDTVGGPGTEFSALVTGSGHITQAVGSFDSVTGVTGECSIPCPNEVCPANPTCPAGATTAYTLQLNTAPFTTNTCKGATDPTEPCQGWQQFVYDSSGAVSIQYWLLHYGAAGSTTCPTPQSTHCIANSASTDGWCPVPSPFDNHLDCVVNSPTAMTPSQPANALDQITLTGAAVGVNGASTDTATVTIAGTANSAPGGNYFPDLGQGWLEAEFNVFGDGNFSQAVFNNGSSAIVRVEVDSGTNAGPKCDPVSWTGESNNMTLQNFPPTALPGPLPALVFGQNNPALPGAPATCGDAVSLGDTHLTTFSGLHYDFQASGDFLLAEAGPNFIVQTRQASGAPTWPDAAVNKAVALRIGKTTIAVCLAPTQLLIDGKPRTLADKKWVSLPDGIILSRAGDLYIIQRANGDSVRARLNRGAQPKYDWIDVSVILGDRSQAPKVRGLLGNPDGDRNLIGVSDGTVLREPVTFDVLYHRYGDSWRVPARESLLCKDQSIEVGDPRKPFYANDLSQAQQDRARAICTSAGVKQPAALADCILDVTVLGTPRAAPGLARASIPAAVWQAGSRGNR